MSFDRDKEAKYFSYKKRKRKLSLSQQIHKLEHKWDDIDHKLKLGKNDSTKLYVQQDKITQKLEKLYVKRRK